MAGLVRQALDSWCVLATMATCCAVAATWYATTVLGGGVPVHMWRSMGAGAPELVAIWFPWSAPMLLWVAALLVERWATAPVRGPLLLTLAALVGIVGAVAPLWMFRGESNVHFGYAVSPLLLLCAICGLLGARMAFLTHPQLFRAPAS